MVFSSLHFVGFFVVVYALYRALPHRAQNWLLLLASYYFYAAWDWRFLGLLAASTLVTFYSARLIAGSEIRARRRAALVVGLAFNLAMLGFFKYFNFFAENLHALFAAVGFALDVITLRVLLPIGISFYTFIALSYIVDVYRHQLEPERSLADFAVFLGYFPQLLAGPIMRAQVLLPQIRLPRRVTRGQVIEGLWLVGYGFFKKVYVADNLSHLVNSSFSAAHPTGLQILLSLYAFAFQIYGDFSGYTDMARGMSKLMGIELSLNFRFPYFVRTPQQFWQHWHISLSTWLRDYLFLPVSFALSRRIDGVRWLGLRDDFWIYAGATMVTMLLGGLWHGAAWNFVLWGAYQGALLVTFLAAQQWTRKGKRGRRVAAGRASGLSGGDDARRRRHVPPDLLRLADLPGELGGPDRQPGVDALRGLRPRHGSAVDVRDTGPRLHRAAARRAGDRGAEGRRVGGPVAAGRGPLLGVRRDDLPHDPLRRLRRVAVHLLPVLRVRVDGCQAVLTLSVGSLRAPVGD